MLLFHTFFADVGWSIGPLRPPTPALLDEWLNLSMAGTFSPVMDLICAPLRGWGWGGGGGGSEL